MTSHIQKTTLYNSMGWKSFQTHGILTDDCQAHETVKIERGGWKKERKRRNKYGEDNWGPKTNWHVESKTWTLLKHITLKRFTRKYEDPVIIYSPSCHSKTYDFCSSAEQKEEVMSLVSIQWKLMVTRVSLICIYFSPDSDNNSGKCNCFIFLK